MEKDESVGGGERKGGEEVIEMIKELQEKVERED